MKEKYYIPHIDEFHHGFSYTTSNDEVKFFDLISSCDKISFDPNFVMVKYLDADDIISLGFDFCEETKDYKLFRTIISAHKNPTLIELSLSYYGDYPVVTLSNNEGILIDRILCLNICELKWLLNRFKII